MWDRLWIGGSVATMTDGGDAYGTIADGAVAVQAGRIAWAGRRDALPTAPARAAREVIDLEGGWLLPGLIDCHTHIVWGGDRADEFEQRLQGVSYSEIARRGGGIRATVTATRAADFDTLRRDAQRRLTALMREGVTTIEVKSGYGLDLATERRQLEVARALGDANPVTMTTTFLGAHALPPEYADDKDGYIDAVCDEMLPAIARAGLADAVDAFGERIAFTPEQVARVFDAARRHHLPVKLHADQLSDQNGAALAARYAALSADHLEYTTATGAGAMGEAGTVAVLLPGAFYYLRETRCPPVDAFREQGVAMAVGTDCNPGSSPVVSLHTAMNMACVLFGLTPAEALAGATRHAATALGMPDRGQIATGCVADFSVWDVESPAQIVHALGDNRCRGRVVAGAPVSAGAERARG
jgi:imidazolonepropionase